MYEATEVEDFRGSLSPERTLSLPGRHVTLEVLHKKHISPLARTLKLDDDAHDSQWRYLPYGPFPSQDSFSAQLEKFMHESSKVLSYAIIKDGEPTGLCAYLDIRPEDGSIEVGHLIFGPALKQTRAASECMYLLLLHAFETLRYRRVVWKCDNLNEASKAAAQRFGFTFEGLWRKALVVKGRNRDTAWFSIIDDEWVERKKMFEGYLNDVNFIDIGVQIESLRHFR